MNEENDTMWFPVTPEIILQEELEKTYKFFCDAIFPEDISTMCKIHDAFGGNEGEHHNCLGCNFADSTKTIREFLKNYEIYTNVNSTITLYILTLYLLVERMEVIFDLITVPENYKKKHFIVFQQIRKWANFLKHPKSFVLVHHPLFEIKDHEAYDNSDLKTIIDEAFITNYYSGEKDPDKQKSKNRELFEKLKNKKDVLVLYPDIFQLTKKLCYSVNKFVDLIIDNEVFIDVLSDDTTIKDYFVNQKEELLYQ